MKTPAEFEPIAVWMGWRKYFGTYGLWVSQDGLISHGDSAYKTSLTDAEAVEALIKVSQSQDLKYILEGQTSALGNLHNCSILNLKTDMEQCHNSGWKPTISAAVEGALLKLIAAEGQTQCYTK